MSLGTVFLTGGTGKLRKTVVRYLASKGYAVVFTSRSQQKVDSLLADLPDCERSEVTGIVIDLESKDFSSEIFHYLKEHEIQPTSLVNNARNIDYLKIEPSGEVKTENWLDEFRLDVVVAYQLSTLLAHHFPSLRTIVNVSSIYGVVAANPNLYIDPVHHSPINYSVCKAALIHLTKELAVRFAGKMIRVNSVSFGGVRGRADLEFERRYSSYCPLGSMLHDNDIAGPIEFLLSEASSGTTGHNLIVDGGWTIL